MNSLLGKVCTIVRHSLRRQREGGERGQAYVEILLVLPLYIVLIIGASYFGQAWYAKIAAETAAYDGARTAAEAMTQEARTVWGNAHVPGGTTQGVIAARQTLNGFYLDPSSADVRVVPLDVWGRGQAVRCDVRYRVDLSGVPLIEWIGAEPTLPVWARRMGQVEAYKSAW
jgi:hypothetical protein